MKNPAFVGAVAGTVLGLVILNALGVELDPARAKGGVTIAVAFLLSGAGCASALQRGLRGSRSGFWQSMVGRWAIGRMAGTAVYLGMAALLWRPAVYTVVYGLVAVGHIAGWNAVAALWPAVPWLPFGIALAAAWFLRTPAKIIIGKGSGPFRRFYRSLRMGQGGSAGFAGICEEWANRYRPGMIFLGHSLFDRHWPVGMRDDRMLQTLAGTGGGKGESAIMARASERDGVLS